MAQAVTCGRIYHFAGFRLDPSRRILQRGEELVCLPPKAIDLLAVLVENSGEVVDKATLFERVWPRTYVVESSLTKHISLLRKALNQDGGLDPLIQTVSKRGYRFVAEIHIERLADLASDVPESRSPGPESSSHRTNWKLVVAAVIVATGFALLASRRPFVFLSDDKSAARREYLIGLHLWGKAESSEILKALARFRNATELHPNWAPGWAGVADTYYVMTTMGIGNPSANLSAARLAAVRARELDPRLALPRVVLGHALLLADFDPRGAEREFKDALKLDPRSARAYYAYACLLMLDGRFDDARARIRHAMDLDPV